METSVHRDRRRRRDDGFFSPITSRVIGVDPVSRVSRLASPREKPLRSRRFETPARSTPRVSTRVRARSRVHSRARIDREYFSSRVPRRRTLTSAAGIARARRSRESRGENARRVMARIRVTHARVCARASHIRRARASARAENSITVRFIANSRRDARVRRRDDDE